MTRQASSQGTRRIRILHVVDNWGMGGLQNGIANLIAQLDPDTYEHFIGAMRPVKECDLQPFASVSAKVLDLDRTGKSLHLPALLKALRGQHFDVVHSRNWSAIESVIAANWCRVRGVIHSEHGIDHDTKDSEPRRRRMLRRIAFQFADQVLSVSTVLRDLHALRTGFPAERISVIHNGVDTRRFAPEARLRSQMRQELGIADGEFCIGCVGNLTKVKDHITVLRALVEQPGLQGFRLLLLGDGPERGPLNEYVQSHQQLRASVVFLGRSRRVKELLNVLDVYVLSSLTEGICNSLLEAMATRLPVIVTQTGGNPEVVTDTSGLLFPVGGVKELASHLTNLRGYPELRRTLAESALRRIYSEFSLESMVRQYNELYQRFAPWPVSTSKQNVPRVHTLGSLQ